MWMAGEQWCQNKLHEAAKTADLILIEGAMGLFDGEPSSADLAARFSIPIALVMDVKGMAQTAAAVAAGLANFRGDVEFAGLIANNCGSNRHRELIEQALPDNLSFLFSVPRSEEIALPERHLGLVQANEVREELEERFEKGADILEQAGALAFIDSVKAVEFLPAEIKNYSGHQLSAEAKPFTGLTIAIARDDAFSFIYDENTRFLESLGATLVFFSPINDQAVPKSDVVWLPGGYPELHAKALSKNTPMLSSLKEFFEHDKVILAECGGFLYTLDTLTDLDNNTYIMTGLLKGEGAMRGKRGCQGMQTAPLPEGEIRGHAHHRSRSKLAMEPIASGIRQRHPAPGEPIYRERNLTATYLHLFFPSNPEAIIDLFLNKNKSIKNSTTIENNLERILEKDKEKNYVN